MLSACWVIDIENDQEHISRSFDHVNIENLAIFMKEEIISRITGVNYINVLINEDPLKYDLSKFMNFLKKRISLKQLLLEAKLSAA